MCNILFELVYIFFSIVNSVFHIGVKGVSERSELTPCTCFDYSCVSMVWRKGKVVSITFIQCY